MRRKLSYFYNIITIYFSDIGVMDESGYISINGRIKEMIIRGGENIYPREIEDFLLTHKSVADAQVIGIFCQLYYISSSVKRFCKFILLLV